MSSDQLLPPVSLCVGKMLLPLRALVDSGAQDSLLDRRSLQFRWAANWSLCPHPSQLQPCTGESSPTRRPGSPSLFLVTIQRKYRFFVISAPKFDWAQSKVLNWSPHCHAFYLKSALSPCNGSVPSSSPPAPPDLSGVPQQYHDLKEVFSKERALSLPPHWPYDCGTDMVPGATFPTSRLYNLSRPEKEAMERYITDSLAAHIIQPSTSPLGAGFFFVEKKDKTL